MSKRSFEFTAFTEAELVSGHIEKGASFSMPGTASVHISVQDNDRYLSGDIRRNDHADDRYGQEASIEIGGAEAGNGGQLYGERIWTLHGSDGHTYKLVELEQENSGTDYFTFFGKRPDEGVTLTVDYQSNIWRGASYDHLGAGDKPPANIVDIAAGSDDFQILVKALNTAELAGTVRAAEDITVFAPTDAAFGQLAADLGFAGDTSDEDAVFDFLVGALTDLGGGDPSGPLTDILLYHVSPGAKTAAQVDAEDAVPTLLPGATFGSEGTELIDNDPDIDNPNIVIPDIPAANGTIQAIDRVLLPLDVPNATPAEPEPPAEEPLPTLTGIVAASGGVFDDDNTDFDLLLNAVQAADLAGALDNPDADLTVFAPNDAAFIGLAQALGYGGSDEGGAFTHIVDSLTLLSGGGDPVPLLQQILLYHVAPESLDSGEVTTATQIPTLQGGSLGVDGTTLVDADPDIPNPGLIATDIPAANGIAHVLDGVLIPTDILPTDGSNDVDFIIANDRSNYIYTGRDSDFVDGNGGNDRIHAGKGDDVVLGGDGHDILKGGSGDDLLAGGTGRDLLIGGGGKDTFVLKQGDGHDKIAFFQDGKDKIDLTDFDLGSFDDLAPALSGNGSTTIVSLGDDKLTVHGLGIDEADQDDFILIA